jgi:uncharacterized membrane protein
MHDAYLWVKFLHTVGTVAFVGWALFAPAWMMLSLRTAGTDGLAAMRRRLTAMTLLAIAGGGILLTGTGVLMARVLSPDAFNLPWLRTGVLLFTITMALWLVALLPLYRTMVALRLGGKTPGKGLVAAWRLIATGAMLSSLATLWLMVVRG